MYCLECDQPVTNKHAPNCGKRVVGCPTVVAEDCSDPEYVALAKAQYHEDGVCEVDDHAAVSLSDEGAYVQAWVWVAEPKEEG